MSFMWKTKKVILIKTIILGQLPWKLLTMITSRQKAMIDDNIIHTPFSYECANFRKLLIGLAKIVKKLMYFMTDNIICDPIKKQIEFYNTVIKYFNR